MAQLLSQRYEDSRANALRSQEQREAAAELRRAQQPRRPKATPIVMPAAPIVATPQEFEGKPQRLSFDLDDEVPNYKIAEYEQHLKKVRLLSTLSDDERTELAQLLQTIEFEVIQHTCAAVSRVQRWV
jgi:hypothetical protein